MFWEVTRIGRRYQNFKRYRHIASVLIKHGFYDFVDHSNLIHYVGLKARLLSRRRPTGEGEEQHQLTRWERARKVFEELGPAFIKLGQFLSNRPDLLPHELCDELRQLLDAVPAFPWEDVERTIVAELGATPDTIFQRFDRTPLSSASIAQVHEALLLSGERVAVKVQRPRVREIINADLDIMRQIAHWCAKYIEGVEVFNPVEIIEEFKREINNELDFANEALNIDKFRRLFADDPTVRVPRVYPAQSARRVLTMEYLEGDKLRAENLGPESGHNRELVVQRGADMVLKQIFEFGYFHADPHPANILVGPDDTIRMVDFGLIGVLSPNHRDSLCAIIAGVVKHDHLMIADAVIDISLNREIPSRELLEYQVFKLVDRHAYLPLKDIRIGEFFRELLRLIVDNRLTLSLDIYLLLKAIVTLERTVRDIQPDFDMVGHVEPFVRKLFKDNLSPERIARNASKAFWGYTRMFYEFPEQFRDVVTQLKRKNIRIKFEHVGLEPILGKHDQISNRLSFAIVTGCMLIAAAIVTHAGVPPKLWGVSGVGLALMAFSSLMGITLLVAIIRHGRF